MALPSLSTRQIAVAATLALLTAGAGTFAIVQAPVMSALPAPLKAAPARVGALAGELRGKVGPAGLRKIKATLAEHNPSRAVERASRAVTGAGVGPGNSGAAPSKARGVAQKRGAWKRRAFGRGAILERR